MKSTKLSILFGILTSAVLCHGQKNCTRVLDLVFVLDGSNSVSRRDFMLVKDSLANSVSTFAVLPGQTRIGVVTYSGAVNDVIPLTDDITTLQNGIASLEQPDSTTATHKGLSYAASMLTSSSRGVKQVIVLVTDGESDEQDLTYRAAQDAKNSGITILVVGIDNANAISDDELKSVASLQKYVYRLESFRELAQQLLNLTEEICDSCDGMDAMFVMDGSNSIKRRDFYTALAAISDTALATWQNFSQSRIGLITYASQIGDVIPITSNINDFLNRIDRLRMPDTGTNTDLALEEAGKQLRLSPRPDIPRVIVLVTDGESDSRSKTIAVADQIKKDEIRIYAIGVGDYTDRTELRAVSSREDMAYRNIQDFSFLHAELTRLIESVCRLTPPTSTPVTTTPVPITQCTQPVALLFVIDGSSEVGAANFERLKLAVTSAALIFDYGPTNAEVGVVSYSNTVKGGFGPVDSATAFTDNIQTLSYPGGPRTTSEGMRQAAQFLINANRSDAVNVMVVMTTGMSDNPIRTSTDSYFVRQMGIQTFALGVTNAVNQTELQAIANQDPSRMALAATYGDVISSLNTLMSSVCFLAARAG